MNAAHLNFSHEPHTIEVYGPANEHGRLPYLGRVDLFGRAFVPDSNRRAVALTDAEIADEATLRRIIAAAC